MGFVEYMPSCVVTILFCVIIPWGVDIWIAADTFITSIFGLVITFFPHHFLNRQVSVELDDVHLHIYRLCGIILLSSSLFALLTRKSRDPSVNTAILWGRVVGVSLYVMTRIYSYITALGVWNNQALVFGIYGDCLWLLGNIIYAFKTTGCVVRSTIHPKGDFYLKLDCIQCILFGLTFYLAPTTMIGFQTAKSLNDLHVTLIRMMAAFVFNTGIIAGKSFHFSTKNDKVWHFVSRIVITIGLLIAQLYAQLTTSSWTTWHIYFGMVGMTIWTMNSVLGVYSLFTEKQQD